MYEMLKRRQTKLNWSRELKLAQNRVKETNYLDLFLMQILAEALERNG